MKSKGLIVGLIVFLVLLIVSLVILMTKMLNGNFMFAFSHNVSKNKILEETYNVMDIDIDSKAADINIIKNDEESIKVVVYSEKKQTKVEEKNNKLLITSNTKSCRGFCFNTKYDKIEIYVPSTYSNILDIKSNTGDISVAKFNALTLKIDTDAGDIDIDSVKKANIKADAGDIDIKNIDSITIDTDAGDIKIGKVNKYISIVTDAGDIKIEEVNIIKNSKIKAGAGDVKIKKTNDIYINAKAGAGDTKIENSNRKSDIELKIKTNAGDIKVN